MIKMKTTGEFGKTISSLEKMKKSNPRGLLERHGAAGVIALASATPKDTGLTADSWSYKITRTRSGYRLSWMNSNYQGGVPVALVIQYGHALPSGYFIEGVDYINPALLPIFESLSNLLWKEVTA